MTGDADAGLAVYVHWPFCRSKCPYCDFNSHAAEAIDQARWRAALLRETAHFAAETGGRWVTSLFFGGGTPSLMDPDTVADLIAAAGRHWRLDADAEITLEANPTSVEAGRFAAFRAAGVNRLSLGIQALDDGALAALGRQHSAREALAAREVAAAHFPRTSFDLIYARPGQTAAAWRRELARALADGAGHVSLYQLTIEPGTAFHRDGVAPADEDTATALYEVTQELTAAAGLPAYEISNHARPGDECRHNLAYWRGDDYLGIGPGAHGRLSREGDGPGTVEAVNQIRTPAQWLAAVEARGHGTVRRTALSPAERREELLMMGLRLRDGVSRARFRRRAGVDLEEALDAAAVARLVDGGFVALDGDGLRATAAGRRRLDAVLAALLA